ncbi:hypothetical protein C8R43DRAFT_1022353 [Mycena crocata]|nr:hypothetical protein C8R43DRAFT_1022353 [Mycena crocata]
MQISEDEQLPLQRTITMPMRKTRAALARHPAPEPEPQDNMDVDEEPGPESEEDQVEVDVLPEEGSESDEEVGEGSDAVEGEPEVEEPEEYELDDEEDEIQESRTPSVAPPTAKSSLKIKFKMRPNAGRVTKGRRTRATAVRVESEPDSDEPESEEEIPQNTRLTKRQAALAKARKGIISSETSADEEEPEPAPPPSRRKRGGTRTIDPSELALRKEESARKRRNVSEKKLQNEKAETINRLLKKQSRPRGRRTTALSTATPLEVPTPVSEGPGSAGADTEMAVDERPPTEPDAVAPQVDAYTPALPTMYRWISTSRPKTGSVGDGMSIKGEGMEDAEAPVMSLSFSIPVNAAMTPLLGLQSKPPPALVPLAQKQPALCGVAGCGKDRRYRLVGGTWGEGACGMGHLKVLEGR